MAKSKRNACARINGPSGEGEIAPRALVVTTFAAHQAAFTGSHFRHGGRWAGAALPPRLTEVASYGINTTFSEGVSVNR